ncbi:MAG: M4 family metallopeptidase, partial [Ferruginibacter sp.]
NGLQNIYTDNYTGVPGSLFRLRESRNGMDIITLDMQQKAWNSSVDPYPLSIDFVDDDNDWSDGEFNNGSLDNAALDVQFSMEIVSDYWLNIHGRNSWDNANGSIKSYVHADELYETAPGSNTYFKGFLANAFWFRGRMTFGDGNGKLAQQGPYTSLDICAHEMGHAITETTCNLVYQWESGALNEGFSDIWAACVSNYAKANFSLAGESIWRIGEQCIGYNTNRPGLRDMSNPPLFPDPPLLPYPSAYKNPNWRPASLQTCRTFTGTDDCGVHSNSSVLNKWFFLITQGENGFNYFGTPYSVQGIGFASSEKIAYLTSISLTPNASYATARNVSLNVTASFYGKTSLEYQSVRDAWIAVAVDSNIYNMSNTPAFTGNNFTSIAVGKNGTVLAGTDYNGVYMYSANTWSKLAELTDVRFNDIKADHSGDFWMAQSGKLGQQGGGSSIAGGINYFRSPFSALSTFYTIGAQVQIPSRNARCIYVDTFRTNDGTNPKVWAATLNYFTSGNSTSGMLGQGLYTTGGRPFVSVNNHINIASGTVGCMTVGGSKTEIYTFVQANAGINELLVYDAINNNFIQAYNHNSHLIIPANFMARSIYVDAMGRVWVGLAFGGIMVLDEQKTWHVVNFPTIFPTGTSASFNAIAGTAAGDVYIGTSSGIVFFERGDGLIDRIDQLKSYQLYTKTNGLPSNQINAIAYDTSRFKVLVATDSGIIFWEPLCIGAYCKSYKFGLNASSAQSLASGNWSNPAIWSNNKIPDSLTEVTLLHNVMVDIDASCSLLNVVSPAAVTIKAGSILSIYQQNSAVIMGSRKRKR